jgi:hypothetical protein
MIPELTLRNTMFDSTDIALFAFHEPVSITQKRPMELPCV